MFTFEVVAGEAVRQQLDQHRDEVVDIVERTYRDHQAGETINPDSYFLRFPEKPDSRIIALPALLRADVQLAGIKWIASFPKNVAAGRPRASAVLILNDYETGYPIACLEAANISSARTAASAAVAARALRPEGLAGGRVAVVGGGVIARNICEYLHVVGCRPDTYLVHDIHEPSGKLLAEHLNERGRTARFTPDLDEALDADVVVFATTALEPYVTRSFRPGQLVLNVSLRDLAPEVVLGAHNILDDVDHCLKANTSPHLAEQLVGNRDFVDGTLADVLNGDVTVDGSKPVIFSPFGLGVLDLAVGAYALDKARAAGQTTAIPGFFGETSRW
ncbi:MULTISPECIES: 2,3-diaminopropionate biosynthesis protein SbnB [Streptomyces]|uniref:Alanine dehydrogenase n=1 Tax=Streptomyces chartreusis NRRL 3882 TaxID=1079985 RepID=A0A2N9B1Y8_STRCX|nr:2,3-diaminopropionate biosynthesis protein SbnB [Streptomyces chartreusis]MYS93519.1 2,3-diaminopropionate biosynthesis protein SbnB [Streptomyces sp. SID5464]SOR77358.1 alanine dehydrogenase [Streptomyces chartreusis NRRL 3882]